MEGFAIVEQPLAVAATDDLAAVEGDCVVEVVLPTPLRASTARASAYNKPKRRQHGAVIDFSWVGPGNGHRARTGPRGVA